MGISKTVVVRELNWSNADVVSILVNVGKNLLDDPFVSGDITKKKTKISKSFLTVFSYCGSTESKAEEK